MPEEDQLSSRAHLQKTNDETTDFAPIDLKKGKNTCFNRTYHQLFNFKILLAFRPELKCWNASRFKDRRSIKSCIALTKNLTAG